MVDFLGKTCRGKATLKEFVCSKFVQYNCLRFHFVCSCFPFFAPVHFFSIINLIFVVFIPTFFLLRNHTGAIGGNVCSVLKIHSALFRIRIIFLQLFISHKTMIYLFMFIFLLFHKLFRSNGWHRLFCACMFIRWMYFFTILIHTNITIR